MKQKEMMNAKNSKMAAQYAFRIVKLQKPIDVTRMRRSPMNHNMKRVTLYFVANLEAKYDLRNEREKDE